jgi:hypothetical protein
VTDDATTADKRWAALAHLGVPLYSVVLPVVVYAASSGRSFRRLHARRAIPFQAVFLALWVVVIALAAGGVVSWGLPPALLALALTLEIPNVGRALRGRLPLSFLP